MLAVEHFCSAIQNCSAFDNLVNAGNMDTPGGNRGPTIVDGDLRASAWAPSATTPPEKWQVNDKFRFWAGGSTLVRNRSLWGRHHGRPYPVRALWNGIRQLHRPDRHHARLGGPVLA